MASPKSTDDLIVQIQDYIKEAQTQPSKREITTSGRSKAVEEDARRRLQAAAADLWRISVGPQDYLIRMGQQSVDMAVLAWLNHFRIAQEIPFEGKIGLGDVAVRCGVDEGQLQRVLRYATTMNLFHEPEPGFLTHTEESKELCSDIGSAATQWYMEEILPLSVKLVEASKKWKGSVDNTQAAFNLANRTELPMFEFYKQHPDRGHKFAKLMSALAEHETWHSRHLVNSFDWHSLGRGLVVDVGGSEGHVCIDIACHAPQLKFLVQDLPERVRKGEAEVKDSLKDRISFQAHNFFERQPTEGADIYLLRWILHDYPDPLAVNILKALIPALKPGSRIIIMDSIVPEQSVAINAQKHMVAVLDVQLMMLLNGRERSLNDWDLLLKSAHPWFEIISAVTPLGSALSVIVVELKPGSS